MTTGVILPPDWLIMKKVAMFVSISFCSVHVSLKPSVKFLYFCHPSLSDDEMSRMGPIGPQMLFHFKLCDDLIYEY